ncbi:MAG: caspase family protein [Cyclobacteriaceae bacterium]
MQRRHYLDRNLIVLLHLILATCLSATAQDYKPKINLNINGHNGKVNDLLFLPDGQRFISISEDKSVKIWDAATLEVIERLDTEYGPGYQGVFYSGALSPDGKYLALGGLPLNEMEENYLIVIDIENKKIIGPVEGHYDAVSDIVFDDSGEFIFSGGMGNVLSIWKLKNGTLELFSQTDMGSYVNALGYDPSTKSLAVATGSNVVTFLDMTAILEGGDDFDASEGIVHDGEINRLAYSSTGRYIATSSVNGEVQVTDASGNTIFQNDELGVLVNALSFSADAKYLMMMDLEGTAKLVDLTKRGIIKEFKAHDNAVFSMSFDPTTDSYEVISSGGINNGIVRWDALSGKAVTSLSGEGRAVQSMAFVDSSSLRVNYFSNNDGEDASIIFDFKNFVPKKMAGEGSAIANQKKNITQLDEYTLRAKSGRISNDPSADGRILEFISDASGHVFVGSDFSLKEYDGSGKLVREFIGHAGGVRALSLSPGGRYLSSGGEDQKVLLWKLDEAGKFPSVGEYFTPEAFASVKIGGVEELLDQNNPEAWQKLMRALEKTQPKLHKELNGTYPYLHVSTDPFMTLFLADNGEWITWTEEGYFHCSSDGAKLFGWHINRGISSLADFYTAEQYFDILYEPELLIRSFDSGDRISELLSQAGEGTFTIDISERPSVAVFNLSQVRLNRDPKINFSKGEYRTSQREVDVTIDVYNGGSGFSELNLFQNGKLVVSDTDFEEVPVGQYVTKKYELSLVNDLNTFSVLVKNKQKIDSRPNEFKLQYTGEVIATSSLYVLAIGINQYKNERYNLNYAYDDAISFVEELKLKGGEIYREIKVVEVYNEEATKQGIINGLNEIKAQAQPEDVFVFYYAGHGTIDDTQDNKYFFVPTDVTQLYGDSTQLVTKAISSDELKMHLSEIKAQKQLVLMDACHSGGAIESLSTRSAASEEKAMIQLARAAGIVMIASSGTQQFATEFAILKHGVFTYSLLEAMNGAGDNGDGNITVSEIKQYMEEAVPELTKKHGGSAQYPTGFIRGNNFPLGVVKKQ